MGINKCWNYGEITTEFFHEAVFSLKTLFLIARTYWGNFILYPAIRRCRKEET